MKFIKKLKISKKEVASNRVWYINHYTMKKNLKAKIKSYNGKKQHKFS